MPSNVSEFHRFLLEMCRISLSVGGTKSSTEGVCPWLKLFYFGKSSVQVATCGVISFHVVVSCCTCKHNKAIPARCVVLFSSKQPLRLPFQQAMLSLASMVCYCLLLSDAASAVWSSDSTEQNRNTDRGRCDANPLEQQI